jgi:ABC-2 type transport system ATP-binding protein
MDEIAKYAVALDGVTRRFGDVVAVSDVSFALHPGTILGLIGPSGSGKTTLIRMLTGTLRPSAGRLGVLGEDPRRFRAKTRERIGYVPQSFVLYPDLTASENIAFVASLFGMFWPRRRRRVREVLEALELYEVRDRLASQLSGGMLRRLALATALVHEPDVLFIDEPTAGVDPILRARIWEILRALRDAGRTLVVTTQYVTEAEDCDAVALLSHGRLLALDEPDALRRAAYGGELVQITTASSVDETVVKHVEGVASVHRRGPKSLLAVVDDAGVATPRIVEQLTREGTSAISIDPYVPTFDEVFEAVVARDEASRKAA